MNYMTTKGWVVPQSFITKSKQRLKQHVDTVYLKNGDEFEIELFNPTQNKVLAKIELNGVSIGSGIVLRPGERVFLERYLDDAKKFLFETYIVNGNNNDVQQAIAKNGDVTVKFYDEVKSQTYTSPFVLSGSGTVTWTNGTSTGGYSFPTYTNDINTKYFTNTSSIGGSFDGSITTSNYSYTDFGTSNVFNKQKTSEVRHLETGRVEKGSDSSQTFTHDNSKVMVKEDLVVYCTECGAKRKKDNHKFCPHCGTKF
jgi:ribosomal protein L44E